MSRMPKMECLSRVFAMAQVLAVTGTSCRVEPSDCFDDAPDVRLQIAGAVQCQLLAAQQMLPGIVFGLAAHLQAALVVGGCPRMNASCSWYRFARRVDSAAELSPLALAQPTDSDGGSRLQADGQGKETDQFIAPIDE